MRATSRRTSPKRSRSARPLQNESDRAARSKQQDRELAFALLLCFIGEE
jgi:hypothetical protein